MFTTFFMFNSVTALRNREREHGCLNVMMHKQMYSENFSSSLINVCISCRLYNCIHYCMCWLKILVMAFNKLTTDSEKTLKSLHLFCFNEAAHSDQTSC